MREFWRLCRRIYRPRCEAPRRLPRHPFARTPRFGICCNTSAAGGVLKRPEGGGKEGAVYAPVSALVENNVAARQAFVSAFSPGLGSPASVAWSEVESCSSRNCRPAPYLLWCGARAVLRQRPGEAIKPKRFLRVPRATAFPDHLPSPADLVNVVPPVLDDQHIAIGTTVPFLEALGQDVAEIL